MIYYHELHCSLSRQDLYIKLIRFLSSKRGERYLVEHIQFILHSYQMCCIIHFESRNIELN